MIRLETCKKRRIENHQDAELTQMLVKWHKDLCAEYQPAYARTEASASYNCHGLTFASRRTWVYKSSSIDAILKDDDYREIIDIRKVLPGDVVVYYSDTGDLNHSGVVVEIREGLAQPLVFSKWAHAGEFVHALRNCPTIYGPNTRFFRCDR